MLRKELFVLLAAGLLAAGCAHTRIACPVIRQAAASPPAAPAQTGCPAPRPYPFRNLVLEGGGVKGVTYGGALEVLETQGILGRIERVAGTSAGAIQASLVALGYRADEIRGVLLQLDFNAFRDGGSSGIFRLFRRFGWYRGDALLELMRCLVAGRLGSPDATFADLERARREQPEKGFKALTVFSTDLSTGAVDTLSAETTPGLSIALAARMSGSLPLFFAAIPRDGELFVDGGVILNYPIDVFDPPAGTNPETLGLHLDTTGEPPPPVDIRSLPVYARQLFEAVLGQQLAALEKDLPDLERTAILDDLGISTTDFSLTRRQKLDLMASGARCTCAYLADWQGWDANGTRPSLTLDLAHGTRLDVFGFRRCGSAFTPEGTLRAAGESGWR